jgi:drug/metabolite transporter (DMT)-like permease
LAYAVIFPTVVAYFLNLWALKRAPASLVAIYVLAQPLIAAALAALPPLRERPTPILLVAGLLIIGGVGLFSRD